MCKTPSIIHLESGNEMLQGIFVPHIIDQTSVSWVISLVAREDDSLNNINALFTHQEILWILKEISSWDMSEKL